jgi:hypothetical protein
MRGSSLSPSRSSIATSRARETKEPSYAKTYSVVEAIYGSPRLQLPFEGLLLIGYWAQRRARLAPIGRRGCCVRTGVQAEPVRAWGRSLASWVAGGGCWRTTGGDGPRLASGRLTQRTPSEIPRPHEGRANQPRDAPLALQVFRLRVGTRCCGTPARWFRPLERSSDDRPSGRASGSRTSVGVHLGDSLVEIHTVGEPNMPRFSPRRPPRWRASRPDFGRLASLRARTWIRTLNRFGGGDCQRGSSDDRHGFNMGPVWAEPMAFQLQPFGEELVPLDRFAPEARLVEELWIKQMAQPCDGR